MINRHPREGTASILILLTDGDPTSGETNKERIMANVKEAIGLKFPLYCLGFGYDVNFDFLTQMSLENAGLARRIYEDSDADLQLQGFYDEVAVPLLSDIQLKYTGGTNLTKTSFSLYFNGSEIVVSGQITDNSVESFTSEVIAVSKGNNVTYQETVMVIDPSDALHENEDFMPRLWAYLTVKQILERQVLLKGQEKEDEKEEALRLSLKYQFVTSLTSMVVTKPQEDEVEVADKPKEGGEEPRPPVMSLLPSSWNPVAVPGFSQYVHSPGQPAPGVLSQPSPGFFSEPGPGFISQSSPGFISRSLPGQSDEFLKLHPPPPIPGIYDSFHDYSGLLVPDQVLTLQESAAEEIVLATLSDQMPTPLQDSTEIVVLTMPVPRVGINRFLLSAAGQSKPLCFDVPAPQKLRLLQDSASEFSMNGQFMTGRQGFFQIAFHYKTNHHLTINTSSIRYEDGQNHLEFLWDQEPTQHNTEGLSLILRRNEMDVTMGSIRVVILLHKEKGEVFLWPAVRQQPKDFSLRGILGKAEASYEEVQGSQTPTLKIMDQEVKASFYQMLACPVPGCDAGRHF